MKTPSPEEVWRTYGDRIRTFVESRVRRGPDADDIVQETFAKIATGLAGVESPDRREAWIFQVTRRAVIDHFRRRKTAPLAENPPVDAAEPAAAPVIASWLRPLMQELPTRDRQALELADLQGLGQKEVAERLGLSFTGAKSRIQRARGRLKEVLLECCDVSLDARGNTLDYTPRRSNCACESCR